MRSEEKTESQDPSSPRAARTRADPSIKRDRIYQIALLMAAGEWEKGTTAAVLAEEWELKEVTVRDMSAEASRLLELTTDDRHRLINLVRVRLRQIAEENGNDRVPACRTLLEHHGELWQRQKHEVTVHQDPFDGWAQSEIDHYASTGEVPERLRTKGKRTDAADG